MRLFSSHSVWITTLSIFASTAWCHGGVQDDDTVATAATPANTTDQTAQYLTQFGAKRVKMRVGQYTVPASTEDSGMKSFIERQVPKPCEDCLITYMLAGLEYPNGSYANADTGMWLHHVVFLDTSTKDTACPEGILEDLPVSPNRFFASGNERTVINLSVNGTSKTGYYLNKTATVFGIIELMNEQPTPRDAVLTMEWEYIPSPVPQDFQNVTALWLDVGGCGSSEVPGKPNTTFELNMEPAWTVPAGFEGRVLGTAGHVHDGGQKISMMKNGQSVCDSIATYGATPGYVGTMQMPGMQMAMQHVSNMSLCEEIQGVKPGDNFSVRAFYDTAKHMPMMEEDEMAPVMGIALAFLAPGDGKAVQVAGANENGVGNGTAGASDGAKNAAQGLRIGGSMSWAVVMSAAGLMAALML